MVSDINKDPCSRDGVFQAPSGVAVRRGWPSPSRDNSFSAYNQYKSIRVLFKDLPVTQYQFRGLRTRLPMQDEILRLGYLCSSPVDSRSWPA